MHIEEERASPGSDQKGGVPLGDACRFDRKGRHIGEEQRGCFSRLAPSSNKGLDTTVRNFLWDSQIQGRPVIVLENGVIAGLAPYEAGRDFRNFQVEDV